MKDYKFLLKSGMFNLLKGLIAIPVSLIITAFITKIVDYATNANTVKVIQTSIVFISTIIIYQIVMLILNIISSRIYSKSVQIFKYKLYNKFLEQSLSKIKGLGTGALNENLTNDLNQVSRLYTNIISDIIVNILAGVTYLGFIGIQDKKITLSLLAIGITQIIPPIIVKKFMIVNYENTRVIEAKLTDYIVEAYAGISEIKLFNLMKYYNNKLKNIHEEYLKVGTKSEVTAQSNNALDNAMDYLLRFGTYAVVGVLILKKVINPEAGISSIVLAGKIYSSIGAIFSLLPEIAISRKASDRLRYLYEDENNDYLSSSSLNVSEEIIWAENLSFSVQGKEILKELNFKVKGKNIVVIKGMNGSGKSTLFNILLGFYDNYEGNLYFRGKNIKNINKEEYYERISYLAQDERGFSMTGMDFFRLLHDAKQINYDKAMQYARKFNLDKNTLRSVKIKDLSGGEKKKIYLISCLLKKGDILLLDEPGNSLDIQSKETLKSTIFNCGKTVLIITHDPFFEDIASSYIHLKKLCDA